MRPGSMKATPRPELASTSTQSRRPTGRSGSGTTSAATGRCRRSSWKPRTDKVQVAPRATRRPRHDRGAALVEFALVSFALYLMLAGTIEFGRLMFDANSLQDVA